MKILDVDFGPVLDGSGLRGFLGEGYPYHRFIKPFGFDLRDSTFVAKTASLTGKVGFLLYGADGLTPLQLYPDCIVIKWRKKIVLNAVGLGNPGLLRLLSDGRWLDWPEPFMISVMPVFGRSDWRLQEIEDVGRLLAAYRRQFDASFGIQLNLTCAAAGVCNECLIQEAPDMLDILGYLLPDMPLMPKLSVVTPPELIMPIAAHRNCHAICISNSVPWGSLSDKIDWQSMFIGSKSPLEIYGGGALSGAPLFPLVIEWILRARAIGVKLPINAGGGIMSIDDARALIEAGADSISLGSIALLRPWRVKKIVAAMHSWL